MGEIEEMVTVFVVRCPLGDQCSKKNGILGKKLDEEQVKQVLKTHLMQSPYHELSEEQAQDCTDATMVESWEEPVEVAAVSNADEGHGWFNNRKRARMSLGEAQEVVRRATEGSGRRPSSIVGGGSISSSSTALAIPIGASNLNARNITLPRAQLKACIDSLKRARLAAESAGGLCGRASRAFYEEAACITGCQDVLESYLAE
jgi:hypothetical protein